MHGECGCAAHSLQNLRDIHALDYHCPPNVRVQSDSPDGLATCRRVHGGISGVDFVVCHNLSPCVRVWGKPGWLIITPIVDLATTRERLGQRRHLRENLDAIARKLGDMQARLVQLDALGERVTALTGVPAGEAKTRRPGAGGPLVLHETLSIEYMHGALDLLDSRADQSGDLLAHRAPSF